MSPKVVLVGHPNVGKSTLFNCLTRSQDALVANLPGLTRDRQYGMVTFANWHFQVVDTGGFAPSSKLTLDQLTNKQLTKALLEADLILLLVDAKEGLTAVDSNIADYLRKHNKPIWLVVNKIDAINETIACAEFHGLGLAKLYPIAAAHGSGISKLLEDLAAFFKIFIEHASPANQQIDNLLKIVLVGKPNVGKSTLINRILNEERMVVADLPGTTRDSIYIPFSYRGKSYNLIDTAGVRRKARTKDKIEKFSVLKTLRAIKTADVAVLILDARTGFNDQDQHLADLLIKTGKALVIAVNKWDGLTKDCKKTLQTQLTRQLHFASFARVRFISALYGTGIWSLFKDLNEAYQSATKIFSTAKLTSLLNDLISAHPPPRSLGRVIKLKYAHLGGHNPPLIVIHGNQVENLPTVYKRYLNRAFMNHLKLIGTPLRLEFKSSENPFVP